MTAHQRFRPAAAVYVAAILLCLVSTCHCGTSLSKNEPIHSPSMSEHDGAKEREQIILGNSQEQNNRDGGKNGGGGDVVGHHWPWPWPHPTPTPPPGPPAPGPAPEPPAPSPDDDKNKTDTSCAAHTNCTSCAESSWGCHWCAYDEACHAKGSVHGCIAGVLPPGSLYEEGARAHPGIRYGRCRHVAADCDSKSGRYHHLLCELLLRCGVLHAWNVRGLCYIGCCRR